MDELVVAVPRLEELGPHDGIGRVLTSLRQAWGGQVRLIPAGFSASRLPVLRNVPRGIDVPPGVDVVLLPQLTGAAALRGATGIRSAVVVHDIGIVDYPDDRLATNWITRRIIARSFRGLRHASSVICVSRFTALRLAEHLPEIADRIVTIPNGVDRQFLLHQETRQSARNAVEQLVGRELGRPLVLYVGSELPRKNVGVLLRAFARVRQVHPEAQLLKVGRPGHPRFRARTERAAAQLGLRPGRDVLFLQDIDDPTLATAYRAADLYASASGYEGFGLPLLEAMAVGTPVVASRRGAHPELVGSFGWLAEPGPDAFSRTMLSALAAGDREVRAARGRRHAASLTWDRAAAAYLMVLRRLAT